MRNWLKSLQEDETVTGTSSEDIVAALHEGRAELDALWESERQATIADARKPGALNDVRLWEATLDDGID